MDQEKYNKLYKQSIEKPDIFWAGQAKKFVTWFKPWEQVQRGNLADFNVQWFYNGKLNACYNCLDRHLLTKKNQIAIIWQGDSPSCARNITYGELYNEVCRFANVLKTLGVKKGDRVCIYLPMIPEIIVTMLACARIGAIHNVIFSGFAKEALKSRIQDSDCQVVITADAGVRGGKLTKLKENIDLVLTACPKVSKLIVIKAIGNDILWQQERDIWYHKAMEEASVKCEPEVMDAQDPLFILYTSGSTGTPKGIVHTTGGYLVYVAMTYQYVFDYKEGDIFWCTADPGWITGHSYIVYGPLANGSTVLLFEGVPNYPNFSRYWEIIDKYKVNIFYTAPTAIRALRKEGDEWVKKTNRKSLKLLGTVGEPINPDVWEWYYNVVGDGRCPIVDTWWQTETGGILITSIPGAIQSKPGAAGWPFFGVIPEIVDLNGKPIKENKVGNLVLNASWPSMMLTVYKNVERFINGYFKQIPGRYMTGDAALRDSEGYFWIKGRNDDIIKASGHRLSSAELENVMLTHPAVAEAAVVPIPDPIKGSAIFVFLVAKVNIKPTASLNLELVQRMRAEIGHIATPAAILWGSDLPKTRSGKIIRRILLKIAANEYDNIGNISTLANPEILDELIVERQKQLIKNSA